ncbi:unnamed protein product [Aphanomyces euteiches]
MRLSLSISVLHAAAVVGLYDPSQLKGISDPILIAKIEGYMPPICSKLYGQAGQWSEWSVCSAECGVGQQVRYLNGDAIKNLQSNGCEISIDTRTCTGTLCPQDCQYSDWPATWSDCDKSTGIQVQSREEITPALNGGKSCTALWGPPTRSRNCDIDCQGSYSEWSECHGKTGFQTRTYNVTQAAKNNGKACPSLTENRRCNPACQNIAWTPYSACDPRTGTKTRTRDIPLDGNYIQIKSALKANSCPVIDTQPCDIDCKVGPWTSSPTCDAATGTRVITRSVTQPAVNCGKPCDSIDADTLLQSTVTCPVHCVMSDWSSWFCDKVSGVSKRSRTILTNPLNGGADCPALEETKDCGPPTCETGDWKPQACSADTCTAVRTRDMLYPKRDEGKPCNLYETTPCTLDAVMGPWSDWSTCDDSGRKTRTRAIVSAACHGGQPAGHTVETTTDGCGSIICNTKNNPWPIDPKTGDDLWGPCDQQTGTQTRTRAIISKPTDGTICETTQTRTCAVNCVLDTWGAWSTCNTCTGLQNRTRGVLQPMLNGGNQCGDTKEERNCAVVCEATEWTPWSAPDDECTCHRSRKELSPPFNGGECVLEDTDTLCPQSCEVSDWSVPEECQTSGPHAGQQRSTRTIIKKQCNSGAACPPTERWTTCNIDCELGNWNEWGKCDLKTQTQERQRPVLQEPYNNGTKCAATTEARGCGECSEIVSPFKYSTCDAATGLRTGTAYYLYEPKQGQTCTLTTTDPCDVSCQVSEWSAGKCDVHTGKQLFTRSIITQARNNGTPCPRDLTRTEDCKVDCVPSNLWGPWSACDKDGFSRRVHLVDIVAQNGGSNDACNVQEVKVCAVDCEIDPASGDVTQKALNGGKTCAKVAAELGLPGDYSDITETTKLNFMAMVSANKEYAMAALATGGVGLMFVVGMITTRRQRRGGYSTIARQGHI